MPRKTQPAGVGPLGQAQVLGRAEKSNGGSRNGRVPNGHAHDGGSGAGRVRSDNSFSELMAALRPAVDTELRAIWDTQLATYRRHGRPVLQTLEAARDLCLRGGKRLRAGLVATGYTAQRGSGDWRGALGVAVAVELLHAYFLIHDDWMDQDDLRRGGPTVHAKLGRDFHSVRLGDAAAVLAGDYTLALATDVLAQAKVSERRLVRLFAAFAQMQLDATVGQQLDVLSEDSDVAQIYRLKTASYTVLGPLKLGALLGGASESESDGLEEFALPLGIAFQLKDDLIGVFDASTSGKPLGGDIKAGKRTMLIQIAFERASPAGRRALEGAFGNARAGQQKLRGAIDVLETSGARRVVERRIGTLSRKALEALERQRLNARGRRLLEGAVELLVERSS
jgi:geranylgeranyl diphosphate synthase type I